MPRPIVVEGPDGAGKSTLVQDLGQALPHKPTPTGGKSKDAADLLLRIRQLETASPLSVFDRCSHISDCIYRRALGMPTLITEQYLHQQLKKWNPVIIYCRLESTEEMLNNISSKFKAHKPPEYLAEVRKNQLDIVRRYDLTMDILSKEGMDVIPYDWQADSFEILMGKLSCAV